MREILKKQNSRLYELTENYRSRANIVEFANQWASGISGRLKSQAGIPVQKENGKIKVTRYQSSNLIVPLTEAIFKAELSGSTCVLTRTNEEATQITGLLTYRGLKARLIQSNDGFNLANLVELRFFNKLVMADNNSPNISDEVWQEAKEQLKSTFSKSSMLPTVLCIIVEFEGINPKRKYKSDWITFLEESSFEDFESINTEIIYVSTIHKAKGKEFDNAFILLNGLDTTYNEQKRQLYVALTRAKSALEIHYNGTYLDTIQTGDCYRETDIEDYPEPGRLSFQLTHRDVVLDHFLNCQDLIDKLYSGASMNVTEDGLGTSERTVVRFSRKFKDEVNARLSLGYRLAGATINFIVYWKKPGTDIEAKILLPEIVFQK